MNARAVCQDTGTLHVTKRANMSIVRNACLRLVNAGAVSQDFGTLHAIRHAAENTVKDVILKLAHV